MARYHENILFAILSLHSTGPDAIKISIFWYPESLIMQLCSYTGTLWAAKQLRWCQLSSYAGAKMSAQLAELMPRYLDSSRARPSGLLTAEIPRCLWTQKSSILPPKYQDGTMSRKHTISYTFTTFYRSQCHQNIDILVLRNTHKAALQLHWHPLGDLSGSPGAS